MYNIETGKKLLQCLRTQSEAKLKPEGGERVSRPVTEKKGNFPKQRSVERLVSLLGAFHRKMNNVKKEDKNGPRS